MYSEQLVKLTHARLHLIAVEELNLTESERERERAIERERERRKLSSGSLMSISSYIYNYLKRLLSDQLKNKNVNLITVVKHCTAINACNKKQ